MKKIIFIIFIFLVENTFAQTKYRITNGIDIQNFIDNITMPGDTLLIEGGNYGTISLNKKLILIGTGFFLDATNSATERTAKFDNIYVLTGADSSIVMSFDVSSYVIIAANNVQILRNKIHTIFIGNNFIPANYVVVNQNFIFSSYSAINVEANSKGYYISNNIIRGNFSINSPEIGFLRYNTFNGAVHTFTLPESVEIENNIFRNAYVYSSIPSFFGSYIPSIVKYNIIGNNTNAILPVEFTSTMHNKIDVDFTNMYVTSPPNSNELKDDAKYQLKYDSPSSGACYEGTDCGAFGGSQPYILSGIPNIPSITEMTVQVNGNILNVQIKAKSNN